MKATMGMNYRVLSSELQNISNRLYDLRQQSATGKKLNKPSDNPGVIRPLLNFRVQSEVTERYLNHLAVAQGNVQLLDSGMDHIEDIMVRAKELGIAAISAGANDEDRKTYANQIGMLFDELLQAANNQNNGQYVFAGFQDKVAPFTENPAYDPDAYAPDDSSTWPVIYNGDNNIKMVEIAHGKSVRIALTGNELFLGDVNNDQEVDPGNIDLFAVLKNFEHAIRENDYTKMNDGLENLENGAEQVRRLRGQMGNSAQRIEKATEQLYEASIIFKQIISNYEDADILDVYSRLVQQETAFEAALNVTSRVSKLSILDFM
jgi:flagellar hook-associated protein 3 FlgL